MNIFRLGCHHMNRKNVSSQMRGSGLSALALLLVGSASETERVGAEAQRLCPADGGVKVYETVTLLTEKADEYGEAPIPIGKDDIGWGYYESGESTRLMGTSDGPTLLRDTTVIVRTSDQKQMAVSVRYRFAGGEFLSGYIQYPPLICQHPDGTILKQYVFMKGEQR